MTQLCDCTHLTAFHVAADYGADPLWCAICQLNPDIDEFELSNNLYTDLMRWTNRYGIWMDLETHSMVEGGESLLDQHNSEGQFLTRRLQTELPAYSFEFVPSP